MNQTDERDDAQRGNGRNAPNGEVANEQLAHQRDELSHHHDRDTGQRSFLTQRERSERWPIG